MRNREKPYTEPYGVLADRDQVLEILDRLEKVETCEEGREYLLSIVEAGEIDIRPVAVDLDIHNAKRLAPRYLVESIVSFTVGAHLNSQAIRGMAL